MVDTATQPQTERPKLPDQSFVTNQTSDLTLLKNLEQLVAKYANGLMQNLGKYQPLPDTGAGQAKAGFFPHGIVDYTCCCIAASMSEYNWLMPGRLLFDRDAAIKNSFLPGTGPGPTAADQIAPGFPSEPPEAPLTVIETSEELTLTDHEKPGLEHCFTLPHPWSTHLIVFGNVVRIHGKISAPGKHIVIFARELRTQADGKQGAELDVSAGPQDSEIPKFASAAPGTGAEGPGTEEDLSVARERRVYKRLAGRGGPGPAGQNGHIGKPGSPGGEVMIVCDAIEELSALNINSSGGQGGQGQQGQKGGTGGRGGPGLDQSHPEALAGGPGGVGGDGGIGGPGGVGGHTGNCTIIVNRKLSNECEITCSSEPGKEGSRGLGGPVGDPGAWGKDGRGYYASPERPNWPDPDPPHSGDDRLKALLASGTLPPDLVTPPSKWGRYLLIHNVNATSYGDMTDHPFKELRGLAQVSHLHKVLETARARYLAWDAYRLAQDDQAGEKKEELIALLDFLTLGLRLLKYVSDDDAKVRDGIAATVTRLNTQLARGLDYFGKPDNFVPIGPPKLQLTNFNEALGKLKELQTQYLDYVRELAEKKDVTNKRNDVLQAANDSIENLRTTYNSLRAALLDFVKTDGKIPNAQGAVDNTKSKLQPALEDLDEWVTHCFGLTPQDFLDCVFNLAFCGSPVNTNDAGKLEVSGHGVFTGITTLASQSAKLITKAIDTLPNDEGQPVNRKHLLKQVDKFSKKLDKLSEAWTTIQNAKHPSDPDMVQLDDPDAYRLLVVQQDFDALLDQFSTNPTAEAAMAAMDAYVDAVQERNALLGEYNALATEYLRVAGDIRTAELQRNTVQELKAQGAQPDLPAETAFVTALYNRMREQCIYYYYLASRSYRFWSLEADTSLHTTLKLGSINQIDHTVLQGVANDLFIETTNKIQKNFQEAEICFPPRDVEYNGGGVYFALTPGYALRLMAVAGIDQIPDMGRGTVIVALAGDNLHIRIFNWRGQKVVDKPESQLLKSESLRALKTELAEPLLNALETLTGYPLKLQLDTSNTYRLLVMSTDSFIPDKSKNSIILALNRSDPKNPLCICTFDANGQKVANILLSEMVWTDLKNKLLPGTPTQLLPDLKDEDEIKSKAARLAGYAGKPAYLLLAAVPSIEDLPSPGAPNVHDLAIVAFIGTRLHIRIFDRRGNIVIDKSENELAQNESLLTELRQLSPSVLSTFLLKPQAAQQLIRELALRLRWTFLPSFQGQWQSLVSASSFPPTVKESRSVVILELVGEALHIRIFDDTGEKVVDVGETEILRVSGTDGNDRKRRLSVLKNLLLPTKTPQEELYDKRIDEREQKIIDTAASLAGYRFPPAYPKELATLRETGVATFIVPPPSEDSTVADHPFAPYCNFRLTRVRAWIDGVSTADDFVNIQLRHKGPEVIRELDKSLIPFVHDNVSGRCKYDWNKLKWDNAKRYVENPDEALAHGVDGDFPIFREGTTEYPKMIGPFAEWEITLADGDNDTLQRLKIEAIYLDFHGVAQNPASAGSRAGSGPPGPR